MINVRLRAFIHGREFWSNPIHNAAALCELTGLLQRGGIRHEVYDDFGHANIADGCHAVANKLGGPDAPTPFIWGDRQQYTCLMAPMPQATGSLSWEGIGGEVNEPREFAGPLPDEVAAHTIAGQAPCACCQADVTPTQITITAFDVHGSPVRTAMPTSIAAPLPRPNLLQRIIRLITGCNQGEAVRGQ